MINEHDLETLRFVHNYQQKHLNTPTIEEIAGALGVTSSAISLRLTKLENEVGYVERLGHVQLRITEKGREALEQQV